MDKEEVTLVFWLVVFVLLSIGFQYLYDYDVQTQEEYESSYQGIEP